MKEKLTKRTIDRLVAEADPARDTLVWDEEVPGLILRLRGDSVTFAFQYKHHGRTRRVTIGRCGALTLEGARKRARTFYAEVRCGGDPAATKRAERRKRATVADVADLYLADLRERAAAGARRGKLSTAAEFERLLHRAILPRIGALEVESLALPEIEAMHRSLRATPRQANAAGVSGRTLKQLLGSDALAWGWSLLAALAHEVTAAGCVLAAAAAAGERDAAEQSRAGELEELLRQRDAERRELAALRQERAASE